MKFLSRITRMPLPIALVLSAVVLCGWIPSFVSSDWREVLPTLVLAVCSAFLFWWHAIQIQLIRSRDGLPLFFYLLTVTAFPSFHTSWQGQVAVVCMLLVLRLFQHCFREENPTEQAFLITLLLLFGSLAMPDMVWLVIVVWLAFMLLRSFGVRVWLATLIGVAVFAIYFLPLWYFGWVDNPYMALISRKWLFAAVPLWDAVKVVCIIVFGVGLFVALMFRVDRDSAEQQAWLLLFMLFFVVCAGWALFPISVPISVITGCCGTMLPLLWLMLSGLAVLFFRQRESVVRSVVYMLSIAFLVLCYLV